MKEKNRAAGTRGKRKDKGERVPVAEILSRRFDIPADLLGGGLTVELRGRNNLYVSGCEQILSYSTEWRRLVCTTYYNAQLGIDGEIDGIVFSDFVPEGSKR